MANRLNEKIKSSFDKEQDRAVVAGMYAFNTTDEKWNYAQINSNGAIKVDTGSSGGGDATSANQTLQLAQETIIAGDTTSINAKITTGEDDTLATAQQVLIYGRKDNSPTGLRAFKVTDNGTVYTNDNILHGRITSGSDATLTNAQQVLVYGRDSAGGLGALKVDNAGHLEIVQDAEQLTSSIFSGTQTIASSASHTFPTTLDKNGSTKYNLLIVSTTTAGDIDYTIEIDASDDNSTFYTDANGGGGGGGGGATSPVVSGIQNAQISIIDQTSRYARISFVNTGLTNLIITSIKATRVTGI